MIFLSRMVRLCKVDDKNRHDNINSCYCAASLITSKHALTAFHCVDGDMESETYTEKSCELRDFSKREFLNLQVPLALTLVTNTWIFVLLPW